MESISRDALLAHLKQLYADFDPVRKDDEIFAALSAVDERRATISEMLDTVYTWYPRALRNILQIAFFRYAPGRFAEVTSVLASHPSFSALYQYLFDTYDIEFGSWLPRRDKNLLAMVQCREAILAHTLYPEDQIDTVAVMNNVGDGKYLRGGMVQGDLASLVEAVVNHVATVGDECAALWRFVFRTDVAQVHNVRSMLDRYHGNVAGAEDDFRTQLRQKCVRTQLTLLLERIGTPSIMANEQVMQALRSTNPAYCGDLLQFMASSKVGLDNTTPARRMSNRISSPAAPFASFANGILNEMPISSTSAQRADSFEPSETSLAGPLKDSLTKPTEAATKSSADTDFAMEAYKAKVEELTKQLHDVTVKAAEDLEQEAHRIRADERAKLTAIHEALRQRETEINELVHEVEHRQRLVNEEKRRTHEMSTVITERDRTIASEADAIMTHVEQQAARIRATEVGVASREAKVEVREKDVLRREASLKDFEASLLLREKVLSERTVDLETKTEDLHRRCADVDQQASHLAAAFERLKLREAAIWKVSAIVGTNVTYKSLGDVEMSLSTTRSQLQSSLPPSFIASAKLPA